MPSRAGPFQHANLDVVTPPEARSIQGTEKVGRKPVVSSQVFRCAMWHSRNLGSPESGKNFYFRFSVPDWYLISKREKKCAIW